MEQSVIKIEDVKLAFGTVDPLRPFMPYRINREEWGVLFQFYNDTIQFGQKLHMGCRPCYQKVYEYIKQYLKSHA